MEQKQKNDFSQGSVVGNIIRLAVPMTLAQLVNVLYNVVDRMYIGRIPENATLALTGLGLCLPIITMVIAFANLYGMGGAPLCSIARGRGEAEEAESIMGNSFTLMMLTGVALMVFCYLFKKPMLYLFGASDVTYPYANDYLTIYLLGTLFVMTGLGMNSFVNSQGFGRVGMLTVVLGAVANIILDPIFIFVLDMGVRGAAIATVISQMLSTVWILTFLTGSRAILRLRLSAMRLKLDRVRRIVTLGTAGFMMSVTNSLVQILCNATLQSTGGDLYVGVMTILNSVREVIQLPISGLTNSAQPVMGFNYGAEEYGRVKQGIRFLSVATIGYTVTAWGLVHLFPVFFIHLFNHEAQLVEAAVPAMRIYFFGFFMMALQMIGQSVFVALGKSRQAIFFSMLRKVIIVAPLTILLPMIPALGTNGVFLAEPVSNFIGGAACFLTMLHIVWRELTRREQLAGQV
ncbi:MATE family efflux transporter [Angelakisella massiliensis]|uniref:MATE family efflux transporter n=1 Tax=Angelakisella massiliensis TaxID=1871018 RepID=UPI0024B0E147|nr:MATE family efflux transporter [Angelakisella massiliensis]